MNSIKFLDRKESQELQVFYHHIYEYKKGLRNLVLTTEKSQNRKIIENRLVREKISYVINEINPDKINVYFGNANCIEIVANFNPKLNGISNEEDFMLGIMLGYDRLQQCERYLKRKSQALKPEELIG